MKRKQPDTSRGKEEHQDRPPEVAGPSLPSGDDEEARGAFEDFPCDTLVAINVIRQEFPRLSEVEVRPFVLRTQLYNSINDRTTVDRDLEELRCKTVVKVFKLTTAKDDYAIMMYEDYLAQVERQREYMLKKHGPEFLPALDWFIANILPNHVDIDISHRELVKLLTRGDNGVQEKHISFLINAGLLIRKMVDGSSFWFAIPDAGNLLKYLVQGRKEIIAYMRKRKYMEILQRELEKQKLRFSKLGIKFHLRDMLGSGTLVSVSTTVGSLIRLPRGT